MQSPPAVSLAGEGLVGSVWGSLARSTVLFERACSLSVTHSMPHEHRSLSLRHRRDGPIKGNLQSRKVIDQGCQRLAQEVAAHGNHLGLEHCYKMLQEVFACTSVEDVLGRFECTHRE